MPEVCRPEDGVQVVKDPAAAAGAFRVVDGFHHRDAGQQAAQDERQQHTVAPRAWIAEIDYITAPAQPVVSADNTG